MCEENTCVQEPFYQGDLKWCRCIIIMLCRWLGIRCGCGPLSVKVRVTRLGSTTEKSTVELLMRAAQNMIKNRRMLLSQRRWFRNDASLFFLNRSEVSIISMLPVNKPFIFLARRFCSICPIVLSLPLNIQYHDSLSWSTLKH